MLARLTIAILMISAVPARADNRLDQAKQQVSAAAIAYRLGRFDDALAGYTKAYELYPKAALLFNIGQCHKNLKDYAKAVFFFEGYLRDAPAAPNRALVEDLIREVRAELARLAPSPPPAEPPPPAAAPPPRAEPPPPRDAEAGRSRILPGALIGGGVAVSAAGAVYYYYGQKRGPDVKYVYDDTRLLGGSMIVLGAGAAATGAFLLLRHSSSAPVAGVIPAGAYVGWAGAW
jgi:tetratricopeptide (TPR) repeat protein